MNKLRLTLLSLFIALFSLSCSDESELTFDISDLIYDNESHTEEMTVTSNTKWTISSDKDWLTISPTEGKGDGTVTISISKNALIEARKATVTLGATNKEVTHFIPIRQQKPEPKPETEE